MVCRHRVSTRGNISRCDVLMCANLNVCVPIGSIYRALELPPRYYGIFSIDMGCTTSRHAYSPLLMLG